jgi:hypothetical protein
MFNVVTQLASTIAKPPTSQEDVLIVISVTQDSAWIVIKNEQPNLHSSNSIFSHPFASTIFNKIAGAVANTDDRVAPVAGGIVLPEVMV